MKSKRDILIRAFILVLMSDRGMLEQPKIDDKIMSQDEREADRKYIYERFVKGKGFIEYMTDEEKAIFEQPIGGKNSYEILNCEWMWEAIPPLLWALNMIDLTDWLTCATGHHIRDILPIHPDNAVEELMASCELRSEEEVALQTEVAMLWHWRSHETTFVPPEGKTWSDCIKDIFGEQYEDVLAQIPRSRRAPGDFKIGKKTVSRLGKYDRYVYETIAYWRHLAFEWIMGEEDWDEVSADT